MKCIGLSPRLFSLMDFHRREQDISFPSPRRPFKSEGGICSLFFRAPASVIHWSVRRFKIHQEAKKSISFFTTTFSCLRHWLCHLHCNARKQLSWDMETVSMHAWKLNPCVTFYYWNQVEGRLCQNYETRQSSYGGPSYVGNYSKTRRGTETN